MYQQRGVRGGQEHEVLGVWTPAPEGGAVRFEPSPDDRYAVVDDLEAGHVVLVVDRWPAVDAAGHLVFSGDPVVRSFSERGFRKEVSRHRERARQPAPGRALRIGDVFWVRPGEDQRLRAPGRWELLDVTAQARRAAHAAQIVAVNPAMRTPETEAPPAPLQPSRPPGPPRPPTGAAASKV